MILRKLHIENFGAFHDFELEFNAGLNELSRPNEFGKTTILEFIRRLFWGFPDRRSRLNLYPQQHGTGNYGGWLEVTMQSGEELKLERRGERNSLRVIAADGQITEGPDIRILSNCSERFYNNIGAITIDELNAAAALDDEEIRTRLYGGGLNSGNVPLSQIRKELTRRADEIYTRTGTRNKLFKMSQEFSASNEKVNEAATHLEFFRKAQQNEKAQEELACRLRENLKNVQKTYDSLQKQNKVAAQWNELLQAEADLKKKALPQAPAAPEIPADLKNQCDADRARKVDGTALTQTENLLQKRSELTQKIAALPPEPILAPPPLEPQPDSSLLELCNAPAAQKVDQKDLDTAKTITEKREQLRSIWKRTRILPFVIFAFVVLWAIVLLVLGHYHSRELVIALLLCSAVIGILFFRNKHQERKMRQIQQELQQIVPDLAFRFALNPSLNPEMCCAALIQLHEFQEFHAEYEREFAGYKEKEKIFLAGQKKREELKNSLVQERLKMDAEIRQLYFAYSIHPETALEKLSDVLKALQIFQQKKDTFAQQKALYDKAAAEHKQLEQRLTVRREALGAEYGLVPPEPVPPEPVPPEELERTGEELNGLRKKLEQALLESGGFKREAERLGQLSDSSDELNIREQIRGEMTEAARECLRYRAALLLLDRTVARGEREHQGTVLKQGTALFSDFTAGRYKKIFKSMESGELFVIDSQTGTEKKIQELSRGTKEQLLLALRLALIASFEAENEPLPVILDDVLVNFDRTRRAAVLQGLKNFSQSRQILLLSAER